MQAFFVDRDGVINHMVRQTTGLFDSPQTVEQVSLIDGIAELIAWFNNMSIPVIEVSNQPGAALGKMSRETLDEIEQRVHALLALEGASIDKVYRCIHHPKAVAEALKVDCECRKPRSGMMLAAAADMGLDLTQCVMLGDTATDMQVAESVGCATILFLHNNDIPEKLKVRDTCHANHRITSPTEVHAIIRSYL